MRGTVLYGPRDVRFEDRETPRIETPTDAVIRIAATCVCGSDLWPYRGLQPTNGPTPMGHEYCGFVEEVGGAVGSVKPGQFVIGSFATSDNTCPNCRHGYQSSCQHREFITRAQAPVLRVPLTELKPVGESAAVSVDAIATLEAAERAHILRALRETHGIVGGPRGAAILLGMKRTTLQSRMRKLGISSLQLARSGRAWS